MLTPYPQIVEYNEAVQNPQTAFRDAELRQGQVKTNALRLPVVLSGGFALTYMMATPRRTLALRCFHREIPAAEQKYAAIAQTIGALRSPYFVGFEFVPDGIRIRGGYYPVLKMDWAEGDPLGIWLDRQSGDRRALETLREQFAALTAFLEQQGIAHGDIQNGNVIVSPAGLKLVDYDGLYVPGMPVEFGCESGHKHFQHPGRTAAHFGPQVDRFSFIAVDLSLAALMIDPSLHRRFRQGGETILFRANDFTDPEHSELFRWLQQQPSVREAAGNFAAICKADIAAVPSLADFRAGRNIPAAGTATGTATVTARYIGPCPIIPAEDFAVVSRFVGQRVELVGRVQAVRPGRDGDGRRNGQHSIHVDFSPARGDGVDVAVWGDDAASAQHELPDERWVGRWASIVGLIDPPRVERGFWSNRTRVGTHTGNAYEIDLISEEEARFRLACGEQGAANARRDANGGGNRHLVGRLLNKRRRPAAAGQAVTGASATPAWRPSRSNQAIVGALRRIAAPPAQAPVSTAPPTRPTRAFSPPRPAAAAASQQLPLAPSARPQSMRPSTPKSGSFVIHPRNRRSPLPQPTPPPTLPSTWERVLRFLGIDPA